MRRKWLYSFLLLVGLGHVHGQQLDIGQIHFRLGMTMNEAQAAVHDPISVGEMVEGQHDTWVVQEKIAERNYSLIGTIMFSNGRIVRLSRNLKGFSTREAKDVGNALFQAVERLKSDDPNANVRTHITFVSSAYGEDKKITIGTGLRRIEIMIPDSERVDMTIYEVLTLGKLPVDSQ